MHMVGWLIVGVVVGVIMSKVTPNSECGTAVDIFLGVLGAVAAGAAMNHFGYGMALALPVAVLGSAVVIAVIHRLSCRPSAGEKDVSKAA